MHEIVGNCARCGTEVIRKYEHSRYMCRDCSQAQYKERYRKRKTHETII